MRFKRGDIVLSAPGWSRGCYVITAVDPSRPKNCYNGMNLVTQKSYRLSDDSVSVKVGEATEGFLNGNESSSESSVHNDAFERGKRRAEAMVLRSLDHDTRIRWKYLASLSAGQLITVGHPGRQRQVQFRHVLENGQKYVFSATTAEGTTYKYPLSMLIFPNTGSKQKRPTSEIIEDFQRVECELSPENLTCDGELPRHQIVAKRSRLLAERARLVQELGREPTMDEIYPSVR